MSSGGLNIQGTEASGMLERTTTPVKDTIYEKIHAILKPTRCILSPRQQNTARYRIGLFPTPYPSCWPQAHKGQHLWDAECLEEVRGHPEGAFGVNSECCS